MQLGSGGAVISLPKQVQGRAMLGDQKIRFLLLKRLKNDLLFIHFLRKI